MTEEKQVCGGMDSLPPRLVFQRGKEEWGGTVPTEENVHQGESLCEEDGGRTLLS